MKSSLLMLLIALASFTANADKGKGGGFMYNGRLLDTYEAEQQGIEYIDSVQNLPGFEQVVVPTLLRLKSIHPAYAAALWKVAKKTWIFVGQPMPQPEDPQTNLRVSVCGVQDHLDIRLYKPCFNNAVSDKDRGELIFHELVRGVSMNRRKEGKILPALSAKDVREHAHRLLYHSKITFQQLKAELRKYSIFNGSSLFTPPSPFTSYSPLPFESTPVQIKYDPKEYTQIDLDALTGIYVGEEVRIDLKNDRKINIGSCEIKVEFQPTGDRQGNLNFLWMRKNSQGKIDHDDESLITTIRVGNDSFAKLKQTTDGLTISEHPDKSPSDTIRISKEQRLLFIDRYHRIFNDSAWQFVVRHHEICKNLQKQ